MERTGDLEAILEEMNRSALLSRVPGNLKVVTEGEVRPSNVVPVMATGRSGRRGIFPMKWGFAGKTLIINARAETAREKPMFREAWRAHRCAIPMSRYFEWEHLVTPEGKRKTGAKYSLWPGSERLAWLAGLYRLEEGFPCFTVLTREPGEGIRFLHDRMPLILPAPFAEQWIRPETAPEEIAEKALTDMICQKWDQKAGKET